MIAPSLSQNGPPAWYTKAREIAARIPAPSGRPFVAKKDKKCATLYLYDVIGKDPWSGTGIDPMDIVKEIEAATDAESLEIHINSPGGYITEGLAIFNAIRAFRGQRTTHVDGIAASMASIIALAGDRVITNEGAVWMIHDPMGGLYAVGTADDIENAAAKQVSALRTMRENMLDIYTNATGQSRSDISAWMAAETWMTGDEAKARGFSDEVVKQAPATPEEPEARQVNQARAQTPAELVATARAIRAELSQRFPGASPGTQQPGQPGTANNIRPGNRQEQRR